MNFEERLKQYIEEDKIYQDFKEHKNLNIPTDFDMFCIQHCEDIEAILKQNAELKERYNNMFECHCNRVEVEQLQNNWNELKKWLEEKMSVYEHQEASNFYVVLDKMQELEKKQ